MSHRGEAADGDAVVSQRLRQEVFVAHGNAALDAATPQLRLDLHHLALQERLPPPKVSLGLRAIEHGVSIVEAAVVILARRHPCLACREQAQRRVGPQPL